MDALTKAWRCRAVGLFAFWGVCFLSFALAAQTNAPAPAVPPPAPSTNAVSDAVPAKPSPDPLTLEVIQQFREATQAATRQHAESLAARLSQIEQALAERSGREFEAMQKANRTLLLGIAALVTVGLIGMALMSVLMFRSVHHLAEAAITGAPRPFVPAGPTHVLATPGAPPVDTTTALEASSSRMLNAIGLLEQRIHELEHTAAPPLTAGNGHSGTTTSSMPAARKLAEEAHGIDFSTPAGPRMALIPERFTLLLEKGQTHLNLEQADVAVRCFDEAIALLPNHAEAHLKRGTSLEKLERLDEALASFDRALALDPNLTTAYLCKGSVCNRLARYDEALRCYDEALRAGKHVAEQGQHS